MKHLVDSDWIINARAKIPGSLETLRRLRAEGLAVSIVSLGELYEGAFIFPDPMADIRSTRRFLDGYAVLNLSEPIMELFGRNRALLRRQGQRIPDLDLLIASTALAHDLTLVTRNRRHFERIPSLRLYTTS